MQITVQQIVGNLQKRITFCQLYIENVLIPVFGPFPTIPFDKGKFRRKSKRRPQFEIFNCNKSTCHFLTANPEAIKNKYNAILISQSTLDALPKTLLSIDDNFLIDKTNKLDRMAFGISGISVLKIKDKQIVSAKSMTMEDMQSGIETFFGQ